MKIRDLDLTDNPVNAEHQQLGLPPLENAVTHSGDHPVLRFAMWSVVFLLMGVTIFLGTRLFNQPDGHTGDARDAGPEAKGQHRHPVGVDAHACRHAGILRHRPHLQPQPFGPMCVRQNG